MRPRVLFFDFDGLLCDTERAARQSWQDFYVMLGLSLPDHVWQNMIGNSSGESIAVEDLSRRIGRPVTERERRWRLRRKQELADSEMLREGVAELTALARALGLRLAVVSSSHRGWVERHLRRLGVIDRFDHLVTGESTASHKPAPELYLTALRQTGVEPEAALAFEDSPSGIRAAQAAGIRCVAVPSTANPGADVTAADLALESLRAFRFADVIPTAKGLINP